MRGRPVVCFGGDGWLGGARCSSRGDRGRARHRRYGTGPVGRRKFERLVDLHIGFQGATNPSYSLAIDPPAIAAQPPSTPGGFDIQFVFSGLTAAQQAIFDQAAAKWESVIVGDLPNATYLGQTADDLLISASPVPVDGRGNILGQAGPDRFRSGSLLPYHGVMQFDAADLASMQADGTLLGVILHEMGHILGIGSLGNALGLLAGARTSNPRFIGPQATAEYNALFGTDSSGVPVESGGGSGTRNAHWREAVFGNELMTGWVGPGTTMPLSRITVASLADLGYSVNLAAADPYTPPGFSSFAMASLSSGSRAANGAVLSPEPGREAGVNSSRWPILELPVRTSVSAASPWSGFGRAPASSRQSWATAVDALFRSDLRLEPPPRLRRAAGISLPAR